jgi:hypothetical protein
METKLAQLERRTNSLAQIIPDTVLAIPDSINVVRAGEIAGLQQSQREFRQRVATLAGAPESEWGEVKAAMETEYHDLERRYAELKDTPIQFEENVRDSVGSLGRKGR